MKHAIQDILQDGQLSNTGYILNQANGAAATQGRMHGWGTTPGNGVEGWAPGAIYIDLDAAAGLRVLRNEGTNATASWVALPSISAAQTWALLQTFTLGIAVTTADLLTVGGIIVPQHIPLVQQNIGLHASKVTYNLYTARRAVTITKIDYTPDIAQGGALTATVVKVTGTATPASATTPMHTANAIDLNATAHTVQPITLTVTGADLALAAGERIGLVLSGAMTVGSGLVSIEGKRS